MKKILLFIAAGCMWLGCADAAVRDAAAISRQSTKTTSPSSGATVVARSQGAASTGTTARATATEQKNISTGSARTATTTVSRATTARTATTNSASVRSASTARTAAAATTARTATAPTTARSATSTARTATSSNAIVRSASRPARAATTSSVQSNTFGTGYNTCRDAYFTCMDQFCAQQNETYRRCVCSSRLTEIQSRERALSQASNQIQDFKDLNLEAIPKTANEVKAMLTASEGETAASIAKDTSASAQKLAGISEVLTSTKSKSLSTAGTLDIAGDINAIWATTDLAGGTNIANLTGESLYNAVHSQCVELVADSCTSSSTLNMVVSAYGMYIENDCTTLANALDKKKTLTNSTIRETEREMNQARLDNYNAHNSTSINDCIAQVRSDITADTACGTDYVHCLDVSGKYLNKETGEPIYTADFYQLETQISLSGDILNNQSNRMIVAELNRKRVYAERGLETCRDLADEVWEEFMRQAITEIYQGQQNRIRQVKDECLEVVNTCYETQSASLKDFSNIKEQLLLGSRLELSEEMCKEKLNACSNLYGGGANGLEELLTAMRHITDQKIAKECRTALQDYAKDMCTVPSTDSLHSYPYACRVYTPGDQKYATISACNQELWSKDNVSASLGTSGATSATPSTGYSCPTLKKYTKCKDGYYMAFNGQPNDTPQIGNQCLKCENGVCPNGTLTGAAQCDDYAGSLYQKLVRYAMQVCIRPSIAEDPNATLPTTVLEDVNVVMDSIRVDMAKSLATECDRLGGYWVNTQWIDNEASDSATTRGGIDDVITEGVDGIHDITQHKLWRRFYNETGANIKWGYCADPDTVSTAYITTTTTSSTTTTTTTNGGT